ncbi:hypothetical protein ECW26_27130 [Escherichia coli W26]|nr:hypothetical protein ECW26_27130 [Escherichia coli W26]
MLAAIQIYPTGQLMDIKYDISLSDVVDIHVNDVRFLC